MDPSYQQGNQGGAPSSVGSQPGGLAGHGHGQGPMPGAQPPQFQQQAYYGGQNPSQMNMQYGQQGAQQSYGGYGQYSSNPAAMLHQHQPKPVSAGMGQQQPGAPGGVGDMDARRAAQMHAQETIARAQVRISAQRSPLLALGLPPFLFSCLETPGVHICVPLMLNVFSLTGASGHARPPPLCQPCRKPSRVLPPCLALCLRSGIH